MTDEPACPQITLVSGQTLLMQKARLYPIDRVQELGALYAKATNLTGGVSTGIGFLGSPSWVIGGALAMSLLEGVLSASARKQAVDVLAEAEAKRTSLLAAARAFSPSQISGVHVPDPARWIANVVGGMFIHDGGEFVTAETDFGLRHIRWSSVTMYWAEEPAQAQIEPEVKIKHLLDCLFQTKDGKFVGALKDGRAIAWDNGSYRLFESMADLRRYRKDGSAVYEEITDEAIKAQFLRDAAATLERL
ncbi:hypothetical protein PY365_08030 [Roseiarcaceae bacterium H3SJ34-1]|uniref:hypothetical protein n=1 Tax=Terripilifer ovatus TaxID=3032367 RepID=UPI003AB9A568|nr:hypothetical protein [Roseiarcaceae bacterium H3SJ34-1]